MLVLLVLLSSRLLNVILRIVVTELVASEGKELALTIAPREALVADVHMRVGLVLRKVLLMEEGDTAPSQNGNSANNGHLFPHAHTSWIEREGNIRNIEYGVAEILNLRKRIFENRVTARERGSACTNAKQFGCEAGRLRDCVEKIQESYW